MDLGVFGTGNMGQNHVRLYSGMKNVDSVRVFDINATAARMVAEQNDAIASESPEDLLNRVDAVSICVPTPFHLDIAKKAMEHEVHMLIEKPICQTVQEAWELNQQVSPDIIVGVGHIERFNPIVTEIKKIMRKPLFIDARRHNPTSSRITGTSVVEDLMIHDVDVMVHLFGRSECEIASVGTPDVCSALLRFGDVPVSLSASRKSSKKIRSIYIEEEDRTIEGDFMSQEVTIYRRPDTYESVNERYVQENVIEKVLVNRVEPLHRELQVFVDCVREGRPFPISPWEATRNLEICERIARCFSPAGTGRSVHAQGYQGKEASERRRAVSSSERGAPDFVQGEPAPALFGADVR
jgi:predicted dehydrogenase